jgi:hypothetical protein
VQPGGAAEQDRGGRDATAGTLDEDAVTGLQPGPA